jgi:hypothetical protein
LAIIKIRYKPGNGCYPSDREFYISDKDFDETKMVKIENDKGPNKYRDFWKSGQAPGIVTSYANKNYGVTHNGKLDEGAVENLLDRGIDGAKTRAVERNNKIGSSFRKIKQYKKRKKRR